MPMPTSRSQSGCSTAQFVGLGLDLERAADRIARHVRTLKDRDDLVADELVDVALVLGDEVGLMLEVEVEDLDHGLGVVALGERGVAPDVAEQHGREALLAAQPDALFVGDLDRGHGAAGDELGELEALVQADHHLVHALGEVADLVARAHALDPGLEVAPRDLGGDPLDLDDRAADPERQQDRAGDRHGEADQRPEAQALEHLLDREIGVALALLDQDRPVERPREHERPEHDLAVRPLVGLDADDRRARGLSSRVASATIS